MSDADNSTNRQTEALDVARAQALQAALGQVPGLKAGDPLPPFFHQIYFWNALPPAMLGQDGHPMRGQGVIPDLGLPRRMWAGGRLNFARHLRAGIDTECLTSLVASRHKTGRTGPLGLVTIRMEYRQNGTLCLTEERDLIYREEADSNAPAPVPPLAPDTAQEEIALTFDTTLLFRYSALTFNGHRIHYDLDYATSVEGYGGLVVHGPLLAQHLMLLAQKSLGPLTSFSFRATAPLIHTETATACRDGNRLWIRGPDGRMCMEGFAEVSKSPCI